MSVFRRDDRHNADLVDEIADGFAKGLAARKPAPEASSGERDGEHAEDSTPAKPGFIITGDRRVSRDRPR
ncbi:MAG: hypothetical protein ACRDQ7_04775 [Haloechinothrix sp.]